MAVRREGEEEGAILSGREMGVLKQGRGGVGGRDKEGVHITESSLSLPSSLTGVAEREVWGEDKDRSFSGLGWTGGRDAFLHLTPVGPT